MTTQTFAPWVEPIAAKLRDSRAEIVAVARAVPSEAWGRSSPLEGWTYKDLLAHLADPGAQLAVLRAAADNQPVDASAFGDLDARNERRRKEREGHSIEQLVTEVEAAGEELQYLLTRLTEADANRRVDDVPLALGDRLRFLTNHDRGHLPQLREALEENKA